MRYLFLVLFSCFLGQSLSARHIIGGVLTYQCEGDGTYIFQLKLYRDCSDPNAGFFDGAAPFTFFADGNPIETRYINFQGFTNIDPGTDDPCINVPANICVQEGTYIFEHTFDNWPSDQTYTISYQRCCRNNTISNISNPGGTGATFTVDINPASQAECNNSPAFANFPPVLICAGQPIDFDHSAVDADGDQLVYELCAPFAGGGLAGTPGNPGDINGCNGVQPDPACPPPYQTVNFLNPPYSALNPLNTTPATSINPTTGFLTGTPEVQGQYVVGVCVSEYRNGTLLGTIRRDFQFNVTTCDIILNAAIDTDQPVIDDTYRLISCGPTVLTLQNATAVGSGNAINSIRYAFDIGGTPFETSVENPTIDFGGPGLYEGILYINEGSACSDSALLEVEIYEPLYAAFDFEYDTCVAGPVAFTDRSFTAVGITEYNWNFGNGDSSDEQNPAFEFTTPGDFPVNLQVTDANGCVTDSLAFVSYRPAPAVLVVAPNDTASCAPATIVLNNLSRPIDETYDISWEFGDGQFGTAISPRHVYQEAGVYDVSLSVVSPIGCAIDTVFPALVQMSPDPICDFTIDPPVASNLAPTVDLLDNSTDDVVRWDYFHNGRPIAGGTKPEVNYTFPDTGIQVIQLIVTNPFFCQDTLTQTLDVVPKVTYWFPNAFTPNNDGRNDLFRGKGILRGLRDFEMSVYDRSGNLVYQSFDPTAAWDGRRKGQDLPQGVYVYDLRYTGPRGTPVSERGFATIIR